MKKIIQALTAASILLAHACICSAYDGILTFSITDASTVNGTAGWDFQALQNISVTSLGSLDSVATNGPVSIGLWDQSGSLLASTSISATPGSGFPEYDYQSITAVTLSAGQTYYLGAYVAGGTLALAETPSSGGFATTSPQIQLGSAVYSSSSGFAFPDSSPGEAGSAVLVPNFQFSVVPEPSLAALMLFGVGILGWKKTGRR